MTTNRFPLFRLPFLALCKVLYFYGPHEIIQLSLCSKQGLQVTKKCWKKRGSVEAYLYVKETPNVEPYFVDSGVYYHYYKFVVSKAVDLQEQQVHNVRVGDAVVPSSIHKDTEIVTFWKNKNTGIEGIVRYIKDLFDDPITSVDLKSEDYKNEFIDTMDFIMKTQESIEECTLHNESLTDKCLTYLLDSCKITEELRIYGGPTRQFRNDWNIRLNYLHISNGSCITLQNLMNIDCRSLNILKSSLTSEDINQFLKHWQNGGNLRIRYARIEINSIDQEAITSGIESVSQPETLRRCYRVRNHTVINYGGLDIKRNDGTTGTIYISGNTFGLGVDPIGG
ncbi:unnamed protein product [Caenorhabditis brenneri]